MLLKDYCSINRVISPVKMHASFCCISAVSILQYSTADGITVAKDQCTHPHIMVKLHAIFYRCMASKCRHTRHICSNQQTVSKILATIPCVPIWDRWHPFHAVTSQCVVLMLLRQTQCCAVMPTCAFQTRLWTDLLTRATLTPGQYIWKNYSYYAKKLHQDTHTINNTYLHWPPGLCRVFDECSHHFCTTLNDIPQNNCI